MAILSAVEAETGTTADHGAWKPIPFYGRAFFATGDMVDGVFNFGVGVFVFYYLTAVCGLPATTAGTLLALSTLCDALLDPLIGSISDTTRSRLGRRVPYMIFAAFPAAISFALLFSVPSGLQGWSLTFYVAAVLLTSRISTSFYILPYAAAGAELSSDYAERSALIAHRTFFNCVGNILLLVLGYWVYMHGQAGLLNRAAYASFGWTCAVFALAGALISAVSAYAMRGRLKAPAISDAPGLNQLADGFREISRNRSFWCLSLSALGFWTSAGLVATLGIHTNLYFWQLPADVISGLPVVNILGYLVGIPLCSLALRRFEKRDVSLIGFAVCCGLQLLPVPLRLAGVLPDGQMLYVILGGLAFLGGVGGTFGFVPMGSMLADAADEHELLFDRRREGLYFAGLLLSVKAAAGLGGFLAGMALDLIHFPRNVASIATHPLSHEVAVRLGLIQGPVAATIGMLSAVALMGYRIDRQALTRIQAELERRVIGRRPTRDSER